ncbi:MAG: hypothetical protein EXQ67_03610 [Thermoleophilia bacterium]|nr:hypothetical protein [Thermoleophilia bacterium]
MPTYEYKCADGHLTEAFQKMTDEPLKKCGTCGKKVERVLFAPSIHYKGTGFYSTDYGKGGKKSRSEAKSEGGETKKSTRGDDAKKSDSSSSTSSDSSSSTSSDSSSSTSSDSSSSTSSDSSSSTPAPKKSDS